MTCHTSVPISLVRTSHVAPSNCWGTEKFSVLYAGKGRKTRNWCIMIMAIVGLLYDYPRITDDTTEARKDRLLVQSYTVDMWHGRPGTNVCLESPYS